MIIKRNIYLVISIALLCTALLLVLRINSFTQKNISTRTPVKKDSVINTDINENKYKYCDIIKITSKYGVKAKKVFYKDNIWDIDGVIHGNLNVVRHDIDSLKQNHIIFDISTIKGNNDDMNLELQIKIK